MEERQWNPIESVPRDGRRVELLSKNGRLDAGHWYEWDWHTKKDAAWLAENDPTGQGGDLSSENGEGDYTHWRELEEPCANCHATEGHNHKCYLYEGSR